MALGLGRLIGKFDEGDFARARVDNDIDARAWRLQRSSVLLNKVYI